MAENPVKPRINKSRKNLDKQGKTDLEKQTLSSSYNHFHNILRLFDVLPNLSFTASETMRDYYL